MKYTIDKDSIKADGTLTVAFDIDNKKQNLSGAPVQDEEALKVWIEEYAVAYARGLEQTAPVEVPAEVKALENKAITVERLTKEVVSEEEVITK